MKKTLVLISMIAFAFLLTGCDLFGGTTTTTTVTTVEVDTENFIDIAHVTDLQNIEMNKSYRLIADLNISGLNWQPLGTFDDPYRGIFDGNGHSITGLNIEDQNDSFNGLFGYLNGEVRNLTLNNINISYQANFLTYAGGIAGFADGDIVNCEVSGNIDITNISSNSFIGMLVGFSEGELDSTTTVDEFEPNQVHGNVVSGTIQLDSAEMSFVGGLIGKSYNSWIYENYSDTAINVNAQASLVPTYVGGLIGHNYGGILLNFADQLDDPNIYIEWNVAKSEITVTNESSDTIVGGFIGFNQKGYIRDNYSESSINMIGTFDDELTHEHGGLIGQNFEAPIQRVLVFVEMLKNDVVYHPDQCTEGFVAGDYSEELLEAAYVRIIYTGAVAGWDCVSDVTYSFTLDMDFLENTLGWEASFYNLFMETE